MEKVSLTDVAMGTVVNFTAYPGTGMSREEADGRLKDVLKLVRNLEENQLSRKLETSELYQINQNAGNAQGSTVSKELSELLDACGKMQVDSEGVFDISIGALTELWKMDERAAGEESGDLPSEEELREALSHCGSSKIRLQEDRIFLEEGVKLELGSVGKGAALDEIAAFLEGKELAGTFSLGGSILTYGEKPDGTAWKVGVTDPLQPDQILGTLSLKGQWCVSTSGDYERYFLRDGVRYHHLLDPATGYPARSGVHSVTILCKSGFLSDALSTACFVLGKERGMELAKKYEAEVLFVDEDGGISMSDGLKSIFSVANERKP